MSIIKLLNKKTKKALFTTPSHNQTAIFSQKYMPFYEDDFSEIEGFDNLSNPKSSIMIAQGRASEIFKAKQTFFITQGATSAMIAAMKTLIKPMDKVLVARNCHKSGFSGLVISAALVDWFMPDENNTWGIYTKIDPKKLEATLKLDDYKVFIMTSPTYEGVNSDIKEISKICKKYKTYLIVDESHGSLYNFSKNLPETALEQGADVSVNSLHKTAGALNQCAILNISKDIQNYDEEAFQNSINLIHTSSPSYPLLANIEACIDYLNSKKGRNEIDSIIMEIEKFKKELLRFGIEFFEDINHDPMKLFLRKQGLSGFDLSDFMYDEYDIEDELNNSIACLYLTGIGTTKQKLEKLKQALKKIKTNPSYEFTQGDFQPHPLVKMQPLEAFNKNYIYTNKEDSLLKISSTTIIPYPPGIGILYPGEAIQKWHLDYLNNNVKIISN